MSLLARYKKPGGFRQLLQLIETSNEVKREQLIKVVEKEDPDWAQKIRNAALSYERVMAWPAEPISQVTEFMKDEQLAILFHEMDEEHYKKCTSHMSHHRLKEIDNITKHMRAPTSLERKSIRIKFIETVRDLEEKKVLILRFIDPKLDMAHAA